MSEHPLLSLSRAAQLLGVTRASLQNRIREGALPAFDGQVTLADLRALFPEVEVEVESSGAFEKISFIKDHAFGKRIRERALPSQEILAQRIFQQSEELEDLRRHLQQYHTLVQSMLDRLAGETSNPFAQVLKAGIETGLGKILASEPESSLEVMQNMLKVVSAQVTVRPSGNQFIVEGNDTLLQSGLKAGLRLNYGCGSGSCGLCKTRLIEGEVRQIAPADYVLSEAERASGYVLSCVCAPVTDIVIETLEAAGPEDIPAQDIVASVRTIKLPEESDAPVLLHLQTPRSSRLRFLAGQSVTLGVSTSAGDVASTRPIASCPCDDRNLHFHLGGEDALVRALRSGWIKSGDRINLRGPQGDFTLDPGSMQPLVFLACDTGFGPIKSLIEHAMAIDNTDTFGLIWMAPKGLHYLDNHCRMWADAYDRFVYRPIISGSDGSDRHFSGEARQAVAEARLSLQFLAEADVYIAGPAEFIEAVSEALNAGPNRPQRCRTCVV